MDSTAVLVISKSESTPSPYSQCILTPSPRNKVPSWVNDVEGKRWQGKVWDGVAKELEAAEPGCLQKIL